MPRISKPLRALEVARIVKPGMHQVGTVPGLLLQVTAGGSKSWVLKVTVAGKRREMGLGGYPAVALAEAHERSREARDLIRKGVDPILQARLAKSALLAQREMALTFKECASAYITAHESGWRNAKHVQQWRNTLDTYAYPVLGGMQVGDIAMAHVLRVLEPIWTTKTETAKRLRGRIESILDWAKGRGYRSGDNPAAWDGCLSAQLARPDRVAKVEHHAAMPIDSIAAFMVQLRSAEGMGARALEFAILTAARSGEVRGATWSEIDEGSGTWTVPKDRMKAGKEHRVPLSEPALDILRSVRKSAGKTKPDDLIFIAPRGGSLSDMTLIAVLRRMKLPFTTHGFRSTFRDWVAERTNYPNHQAEMALAHTIGDKVEAAYRRGDLFDKRRAMMTDWANFIGRAPAPSGMATPATSDRTSACVEA